MRKVQVWDCAAGHLSAISWLQGGCSRCKNLMSVCYCTERDSMGLFNILRSLCWTFDSSVLWPMWSFSTWISASGQDCWTILLTSSGKGDSQNWHLNRASQKRISWYEEGGGRDRKFTEEIQEASSWTAMPQKMGNAIRYELRYGERTRLHLQQKYSVRLTFPGLNLKAILYILVM